MAKLKGKSPSKAQPGKPIVLVFGTAGVGKTWGAAGFPRTYYIDCEGGCNLPHYTERLEQAGSAYMGPEDGANDPEVVLEQIQLLGSMKHDFLTVVIDSYSKLFNTAVAVEYERLEKTGNDMSKTFGREKKPAVNFTRKLIRRLELINVNALFVCHQKDEWKDSKVVGETFDGWDKLAYEFHLVLQTIHVGKKRLCRVGKSRLAQFEEGKTFEWNYDSFANLYGQTIMEEPAKQVNACTPEQVQQVVSLAGRTKLSDETRLKWFDKAAVENWSEMDRVTLQKCIDFLSALPQGDLA